MGEPPIELKTEAATLFVHEPFSLRLKSSGDAPLERPTIPDSHALTVRSIRSLPDANGFRIELIAEQPGVWTLPSFSVVSGERTLRTAPLRLSVSEPRPADEMELSIRFSNTELVVDEPVQMTLQWTSHVPFVRCQELEATIPLLRDSDWDVYALDPGVPEAERIGLPINGERVIARKWESTDGVQKIEMDWMLIPRRAGVFDSRPPRFQCALMSGPARSTLYPSYFDNHFFYIPSPSNRFERIFLSVPVPDLRVDPLPESGRTHYYAGIVGPYEMSVSVEPEQCVVGQPMLLHVTLTGLRFARHLAPLPPATFDALRTEFRVSPEPIHDEITGTSRVWTYALRPLRAGQTAIPALVVQSFDLERNDWRITRTDPLPIRVDPDGQKTVYTPYDAARREIKTPASGIRENRKQPQQVLRMNSFLLFFARSAWIFWILPPVLYGLARPRLRRRDRCRADPVYARAVRAQRCFFRHAWHSEEDAWRRYLADRLNLNANSITFESLQTALREHDLPEDLVRQIRERFGQTDRRMYGAKSISADGEKRAPSAATLVRRIEKAIPLPLLLLCLLCPAATQAVQAPEDTFSQAMEIADARPDEARPLFTRAALGFEARKEWNNAGNSWFFSGEHGRALANYLAAYRLNPFDRTVREQIAFIRAQRPERFHVKEKSIGRFREAWRHFGQWDASIRFGLLTLLWLGGWTAFFLSRWVGRPIPRPLRISFLCVALIPACSLVYSGFQPPRGVLLQRAETRLGPGYAYEPAYNAPVGMAVEFEWIEQRGEWIHARFPDGNRGWIVATACTQVR